MASRFAPPLAPLSVAHEQAAPLTYDDLRELPDDGHRYELLDGYLLVTPSPNIAHQTAVGALIVLLRAAAGPEHLVLPAPTDWRVDERNVFEPDVLVVRRDEVGELRLDRPPLLAVEVLSPSTRVRDRTLKQAAYRRAGLRHYWVVDPEGPTLTVLTLDAAGQYVETASVAGDERVDLTAPFPVTVTPAALFA